MSVRYWLQLSLTKGIGPVLSRRIVEAVGSAEAACRAGRAEWATVEGVGTARADVFAKSVRDAAALVDDELAEATDAEGHVIGPDDDEYPLLLKDIPDPPVVLYCRGSIQPRDLNGVAVVGSRKCSLYGREQAERFGALLGGAGITVLSGGARGIDTAAHNGAMSHLQGRTIAVLGCGIDVTYPPENAELFDDIAERGAVLSEYPIGTAPLAENFPKRNRIVSGMSRGVLVIEADERSGALITARQAGVDQGRTVFALPGRVDNKLSIGPHQLIRDGATLVTSLDDILEGLGPLPQSALEPSPTSEAPRPQERNGISLVTLSAVQSKIVAVIGVDPVGVDAIADAADLDVAVVMREMTVLTLKGTVKRVDGQRFVRA